MFKHILIGTDGSELAQKAVTTGLTLAKELHAQVTAVTVTPPWDVVAAVTERSLPNPVAASVARGKDLAERVCAGCHAIMGNEARTIQGRLVPSLSAIAGSPNATTERLKAVITTPRHPMPATPLALSEIDDLASYIRSLQ